jgi:hypothetical protein
MGHAVIANVNAASSTTFPSVAGMSATGSIESTPIVTANNRPLFLWQHTLAPGSAIHWNRPPVGHLIYTWRGCAETDGCRIDEDGMLIVEQDGLAVLRAGATPVTILHFYRPSTTLVARGGGAHVVNHAQALHYAMPNVEGSVFADSSCPNCELWFHKNELRGAYAVARHLHTEDEIIFVVKGSMSVGRRQLPVGSALAIDANTVYGFSAGEGGLTFVNFRAQDPFLVMVTPDGNSAPIREYDFVHDAAAKSAHRE